MNTMMIYMIVLLLVSDICVSIGDSKDNKMIDNDNSYSDVLVHKRKLITELDNRIRRKNVFNKYDEKLIEDIILYDITNSNNTGRPKTPVNNRLMYSIQV